MKNQNKDGLIEKRNLIDSNESELEVEDNEASAEIIDSFYEGRESVFEESETEDDTFLNSNNGHEKREEVFSSIDIYKLYLKDFQEYQQLTREEEIELCKRIKRGDESAKERFILCNLRLGLEIAKEYHFPGLSKMDFAQAANIGIMKALEKYDYHDARFATFAYPYCKDEINIMIENFGGESKYKRAKSKQISDAESKLQQKLRREPTLEELAKELNISVKSLERHLVSIQRIVSLDELINDNDSDGSFAGNNLEDKHAPDPEELLIGQSEKEALIEAMKQMTEREVFILRHLFPEDEGEKLTYAEIGAKLGISGEAVRQSKNRILKRLNQILTGTYQEQ